MPLGFVGRTGLLFVTGIWLYYPLVQCLSRKQASTKRWITLKFLVYLDLLKRSPEQEWSSRLELLEDESDDDNSFKEWLKRVANCLKGRKKEEPDIDNLPEEEKCMKVVRSVLDEETVLDMMKSFLHLTKVISFLSVNI